MDAPPQAVSSEKPHRTAIVIHLRILHLPPEREYVSLVQYSFLQNWLPEYERTRRIPANGPWQKQGFGLPVQAEWPGRSYLRQ